MLTISSAFLYFLSSCLARASALHLSCGPWHSTAIQRFYFAGGRRRLTTVLLTFSGWMLCLGLCGSSGPCHRGTKAFFAEGLKSRFQVVRVCMIRRDRKVEKRQISSNKPLIMTTLYFCWSQLNNNFCLVHE